MGLVSVIHNLQVRMCTLSPEMETEYLAHTCMSYSGNQTILGWSVNTIWMSGYKKMLHLVFKIITQKKHIYGIYNGGNKKNNDFSFIPLY